MLECGAIAEVPVAVPSHKRLPRRRFGRQVENEIIVRTRKKRGGVPTRNDAPRAAVLRGDVPVVRISGVARIRSNLA